MLVASAILFILGFMYPLLQSGFGIGPFTIKKEYVYISSSFLQFFDQGKVFMGMLLLFLTINFPNMKNFFCL